jgi:hypothetical protein
VTDFSSGPPCARPVRPGSGPRGLHAQADAQRAFVGVGGVVPRFVRDCGGRGDEPAEHGRRGGECGDRQAAADGPSSWFSFGFSSCCAHADASLWMVSPSTRERHDCGRTRRRKSQRCRERKKNKPPVEVSPFSRVVSTRPPRPLPSGTRSSWQPNDPYGTRDSVRSSITFDRARCSCGGECGARDATGAGSPTRRW